MPRPQTTRGSGQDRARARSARRYGVSASHERLRHELEAANVSGASFLRSPASSCVASRTQASRGIEARELEQGFEREEEREEIEELRRCVRTT